MQATKTTRAIRDKSMSSLSSFGSQIVCDNMRLNVPTKLQPTRTHSARTAASGNSAASQQTMAMSINDQNSQGRNPKKGGSALFKQTSDQTSDLQTEYDSSTITGDQTPVQPVLPREYHKQLRLEREQRAEREKTHATRQRHSIRFDRDTTIKVRVQDIKSSRSMNKMKKAVDETKKILEIFPKWAKDFNALCDVRLQEEEALAQANAPVIKVVPDETEAAVEAPKTKAPVEAKPKSVFSRLCVMQNEPKARIPSYHRSTYSTASNSVGRRFK